MDLILASVKYCDSGHGKREWCGFYMLQN